MQSTNATLKRRGLGEVVGFELLFFMVCFCIAFCILTVGYTTDRLVRSDCSHEDCIDSENLFLLIGMSVVVATLPFAFCCFNLKAVWLVGGVDISVMFRKRGIAKKERDPESLERSSRSSAVPQESWSKRFLDRPLTFIYWLYAGSSPSRIFIWAVFATIFLMWFNFTVTNWILTQAAEVCMGTHGMLLPGVSWPPTSDIVGASELAQECPPQGCNLNIERVIHQTYKSEALLHEDHPEWAATPKLWQSTHPAWKYMFWSDQGSRDFIAKEFAWFLPVYDSYRQPIQRADAIRYFVLYHYGGLYVDMDLTPKRNIEPLLRDSDIVLFETPNLGLTNMILASKNHSMFMKCIIENLADFQHKWHHKVMNADSFEVMSSTGPMMLWGLSARNKCGKHFVSGAEHMRLVKPSAMGRCSACKVGCNQEQGILNHLVGSSWHRWDARLLQFAFLCHPQVAAVGAVLLSKFVHLYMQKYYGWSEVNTEDKSDRMLFGLRHGDGIRTVLLVFISFVLWMNRRYYGP